MKKVILFIFLIISNLASRGQSGNYVLSVNFGPSFINSSNLIIQHSPNQSFIDFKISSKPEIHDIIPVDKSDLDSLDTFLSTYKFQIKNSIDTIGSHKVLEGKDSVTVYSISAGLDGITVNGTLNQNTGSRKFAFWSPKQNSQNAKLIAILFELLNRSENKEAIVNYIEQLEQYFPHHLGLKKLSDNPLKYKLYGSITIADTTELTDFFNSLDHQKSIQIDMSNFTGMGTLLYPIIENYWIKYNNIYWLKPSYAALVNLYEMGIPNEYIISKKKIVSIKEEGGSEVITTQQFDN